MIIASCLGYTERKSSNVGPHPPTINFNNTTLRNFFIKLFYFSKIEDDSENEKRNPIK